MHHDVKISGARIRTPMDPKASVLPTTPQRLTRSQLPGNVRACSFVHDCAEVRVGDCCLEDYGSLEIRNLEREIYNDLCDIADFNETCNVSIDN